ncbi:MAG TPA: arsenate reductase ArsC [Candidatus Tectomicrobia bacterium]
MCDRMFHVLFLCTGNSARSIMAEVLMNQLGQGKFLAHSAGSHPRGSVHPLAIETLQGMHLPVDGLRSKSWEEFAGPDAPPLDFLFTVCDDAAAEVCPVWPGAPMTAHWGVEDPAAFTGTEAAQRQKFLEVALLLRRHIELFINLPTATLSSMTMRAKPHAMEQDQ